MNNKDWKLKKQAMRKEDARHQVKKVRQERENK